MNKDSLKFMATQQSLENNKREQKWRKKDPKSWVNIAKRLPGLTENEKLKCVEEKYNELYNETRVIENLNIDMVNKYEEVVNEIERVTTEYARSLDIRAKLENVCRELQKQNKEIKDETAMKLKLEEEKRKEVTNQLQKTLTEISSLMNENQAANIKLQDDNQDMSTKIASLYHQFDERENDIKKLNKQMELEKQLSKATVAKAELELQSEREIWKKEVQILQDSLVQKESICQVLEKTIQKLEENINVYKSQYENFEGTLIKSNKMFDDCKVEMIKMSKKIASLSKDAQNWKQRFENAAQTIIELTTDKHKQEIEVINVNKRFQQLQKLCRQLQLDRAAYLKLLKANGIEPVSEIIDQDGTAPKINKKELELEQLQNELKFIQTQLNLVDRISNTKQTRRSGKSRSPEGKSKSKSKSPENRASADSKYLDVNLADMSNLTEFKDLDTDRVIESVSSISPLFFETKGVADFSSENAALEQPESSVIEDDTLDASDNAALIENI